MTLSRLLPIYTGRQPFIRCLLVLSVVLSLVACGGSNNEPEVPANTPPTASAGVPANTPPTASAGDDQVVQVLATVTLNGDGNDAESDISVQWAQISGTLVSLTPTDALISTFTAPDIQTSELLEFELSVSDSEGLVASDTLVVTVNPSDTGGGSTPSEPPSQMSSRIINIRYDFDNNGTFEGLLNKQYDNQNRYEYGMYTYIDDGTPDEQFESFSIASSTPGDESTQHEEFYTLDGDNRVREWRILVDGVVDGGLAEFVLATSFSDDYILDSSDISATDLSTTTTSLSLSTSFSYLSDALAALEQRNVADNSIFSSAQFSYLDDGRLDTVTNESNHTLKLTWKNATRIEKRETINNNDGSFINSVTYRFDAERLVKVEHQIRPGFLRTFTRYDFILSYDSQGRIERQDIDLGANGSIEATVTFEWTDAPCVQTIFWIHGLIDAFLQLDPQKPRLMPGAGWGLPRSCPISQ